MNKLTADENEEMINFSLHIESLVKKTGGQYLDVIIEYCNDHNIDLEIIPRLLSDSLKAKLEIEAEELNLIKGSRNIKLPL